jgi:uncharacterized protein (TIGR00106 family)
MAVAEISIIPLGVPGTSLSAHVARVLKVLKESSLQFELTAMGTIITGDLEEILQVLRKMHESCFSGEVNRVLTQIKIDDRRDKRGSPEQKIHSVMSKLTTP